MFKVMLKKLHNFGVPHMRVGVFVIDRLYLLVGPLLSHQVLVVHLVVLLSVIAAVCLPDPGHRLILFKGCQVATLRVMMLCLHLNATNELSPINAPPPICLLLFPI